MRTILLALVITLAAGCSQVSYKGDLDDADVPWFFSGAMAEQEINGTEAVIVVLSSLFDTCGLATQFLADVNEDVDDEDDVIDAMAAFAKDRLPQDWWLQVVIIGASDDDDIDGAELGDEGVSMSTIVCHFTEAIDIDDDSPDSFCGTNDEDGDIEVTEFEKDERIVIESDLDLVRFDDGDTKNVGSIKGGANASFCEGFSDEFDDFFDACEDGEEGCNAAAQKMFAVVNPVEGGVDQPPPPSDCDNDADCANEDENTVCDTDVGICVAPADEECVEDSDCFVLDEFNSPVIESDSCDTGEVAYIANGRSFCGIEDGADDVFCSDIDFATAAVESAEGFEVFICVAEVATCDGGSCNF